MTVKVKQYYINVERYDWIAAADHLFGVESIFHRNRERVFTRLIQQYADRTIVLDVGCGTGLLLRHMKEDAIGLDINPWSVKRAKEHTGRQIIRGDAELLPLRPAVFDLVVCTETLEQLSDPLCALEEMRDALKLNGEVIGSVPHLPGEPFHHNRTRSQVAALLRSSGLNTNFVGDKP